MIAPKKTFAAAAVVSLLIVMVPPATAVVKTDGMCAPVDGVLPLLCVTVTIVISRQTNAYCTSRGTTVPSGEFCYAISYDLFASTLIPGLGLDAQASGGHYSLNCPNVPIGSLQTTCSDGVDFEIASTSPHCDHVNNGQAQTAILTVQGAATGTVCQT
jgi:hypothetical protein